MYSTTGWREISSKGGIMKMRNELLMPSFYSLHALCKLFHVAMNELWKKSRVVPPCMGRPSKWPVGLAVGTEAEGVRPYLSSPHPREQSGARHEAGNKRAKDECPSWNPSAEQSQEGSREGPCTPPAKEAQATTACMISTGLIIFLKRNSRNRSTRTFWVNGYLNGKTDKVRKHKIYLTFCF